MAALTKPKPLSEFTRLAGPVYLYTPPADDAQSSEPASTASQPAPDLIIICAWMDAYPRNIAKYTAHYKQLYPASPLLLITCSVTEMVFSTYWLLRRNMRSAVDVVVAHTKQAALEDRKPRMTLHLFSNGGAMKACTLATAYRARAGQPLPASAVVVDSAPSLPTYWRIYHAMTVGLPKNVLIQVLGRAFVHAVVLTYAFGYWVLRWEHMYMRLRRELVMASLLPRGAKRLYLYSEADRMVWYRHVEAHADETEATGVEVSRVRFKSSAHAGHVIEDHSKYWNAVQEVLQKGISSVNSIL